MSQGKISIETTQVERITTLEADRAKLLGALNVVVTICQQNKDNFVYDDQDIIDTAQKILDEAMAASDNWIF